MFLDKNAKLAGITGKVIRNKKKKKKGKIDTLGTKEQGVKMAEENPAITVDIKLDRDQLQINL